MIDIKKQIAFWKNSATEDWSVAKQLVNSGTVRHGLFFVHLTIEKLLKALICKNSHNLAPRIHNLSRLAGLAGIALNSDQVDLLAEINTFHIEGRYPESFVTIPSNEEALNYIVRVEKVYSWLMNQL